MLSWGAQQDGVPVPEFNGEEGSSGTVRVAGPAAKNAAKGQENEHNWEMLQDAD